MAFTARYLVPCSNSVLELHHFCRRLQCSSPLRETHNLRKEFNLQQQVLAISSAQEVKTIEKPRFRWVEIGSDITKEQKQAISQLPVKMTKRCKALMKQLICYSPEKGSVSVLLGAWVRSMKPKRADWLAVLKELDGLNNPFYFEVAELALVEESFEANIRDYTKIIHGYAKQNLVREAENMVLTMKNRGFICDQALLTVLIHMYSKVGNLKLAEDTFEELMLLGGPLDRRSYGSMVMAYIRAGELIKAEGLLRVMDDQEIYAGREVYKALLRAYSMIGDSKGAQRVFDALQLAGIIPDAKICGLVVNAYLVAGQLSDACIAFENMRTVGIEPNDKCVALLLTAYERENDLNKALDILIDLEKGGVMLGKEASNILARWFRRLGVIEEVEVVLREYKSRAAQKEGDDVFFHYCAT
nr:pentatricopeptide repeat-containing protein At1g01970 [Ipomoea batatas]